MFLRYYLDMSEVKPALYTAFLEPTAPHGGKKVAVFEDVSALESNEMQILAASSGAPLSVFIVQNEAGVLELRVFTPTQEKGESDSGTLAALHHLHTQGEFLEQVTVKMSKDTLEARWGQNMWWLEQGKPSVKLLGASELETLYGALGLDPGISRNIVNTFMPLGLVRAARPKLVIALSRLRSLELLEPNYGLLSKLCRPHGAGGAIALALEGERLAQRYFMVGEQKEDNAGANTAACSAAYLLAYEDSRKLHPVIERRTRFEIAQGVAMGRPSRLFVGVLERSLWVGGRVEEVK